MQSLSKIWQDMMQIPEARWIVLATLLLFAVLIAIYVSFYFRDLAIGRSDEESTDMLTDLRRMKDEGYLDEDEFSRAKSQMHEFRKMEESNGDSRGADPEKKFLTLAEAQKLKEHGPASSDSSDQEKESDLPTDESQ